VYIYIYTRFKDGAKCDIMRLQQVFGNTVTTAVQDPSYPVYVDTSVMMGQTGTQDPTSGQYGNIIYMKCNPENNFFPSLKDYPRADIVYICSPKYVALFFFFYFLEWNGLLWPLSSNLQSPRV
jgi:aspartate/methionine/tyrosine aminotransferase